MKRRLIGSAIVLALIVIPSVLILLGNNGVAIGIFFAVSYAIALFLGLFDELIELFKKDSVFFKHSNGYKAGYAYLLENTDQNKIYQRVFSKIFAENGNTMFWFKIFNMKNENLLREATEIMLSEKKLRDFSKELEITRNYLRINDKVSSNLEQLMNDDLIILEEKFKEFRDEVMETEIEHDLNIDKLMEMAVKVRTS